jgi:hypothetical protein
LGLPFSLSLFRLHSWFYRTPLFSFIVYLYFPIFICCYSIYAYAVSCLFGFPFTSISGLPFLSFHYNFIYILSLYSLSFLLSWVSLLFPYLYLVLSQGFSLFLRELTPYMFPYSSSFTSCSLVYPHNFVYFPILHVFT